MLTNKDNSDSVHNFVYDYEPLGTFIHEQELRHAFRISLSRELVDRPNQK